MVFAVRRALSRRERLLEVLKELLEKGLIERDAVDWNDPLGFLIAEDKNASVTEAAYRFCRREPGIDVVLSGTGNPEHLRQNVESLLKPPLAEEDAQRLRQIFSRVDCVTGS